MEDQPAQNQAHGYAAHATVYIATIITIIILVGIFAVMLQQKIITINGLGSILGGVPQTPKQMLLSDMKANNNVQNLQVQYKLGIPSLSSELSLIGGSNGTINMTLDMLNNRTSKVLVVLGSYGAEAVYSINGTAVTCTELSSLSAYSSGLTCEPGASTSQYLSGNFSIGSGAKAFNYTSVKFNGTRNIAGDDCNLYDISITPQNLTKILNATSAYGLYGSTNSGLLSSFASSLFGNSTITVSECISKSYGIDDQLSLSYGSYSKLLSKNITTTLMTINATSISHQSFNAQTFQLPITSSVNLVSCTPTKIIVNFTSYEDTSNSTILVSNLSYKNYSFYNVYSTTTVPYSESTLHSVPNVVINLGQPLKFGKSYNVSGSFTTATNGIPTGTYLYPNICVNGSCQQKYCYVYQPYNYSSSGYYNYTTTPAPVITNNTAKVSSGSTVYPVNVVYQAGGSYYPSTYNNQTNPSATFSNGTGTGGTMTTRDAWDSQNEYSTWVWYFNNSVNGTFYVKWKSSVTPCSGYPIQSYIYLDAYTPYVYGQASQSSSSSYNTWTLNTTNDTIGLTTTKITGKYSAISLEQYSDTYDLACPLNTTVYGVWATKS
ncbi:MAG: hypothetical protein KGH98_01710 [Candidatus Micrarchaeota archaeon]|nr:hypothetical protein [Candidatus Micrarchaeota archaeon]